MLDRPRPPADPVCPHRTLLLDQIADKWSMLILASICQRPLRFNALKRHLSGITQKSLTQTLRRLERNGLIERRVLPTAPVAVEYLITPLGLTLKKPIAALYAWTADHGAEVEEAQKAFDGRAEGPPASGERAAEPPRRASRGKTA